MKEKELAKFVEWLVQSGESPEGASFDETVSWINELATSEEGQQILGRLIQTYKNKEMGIFKEGGKLDYLLCLKKGGAIQDCGCGKKIEKAQGGSDGLRERGSINAYDERYPEFNRDSTWSIVSTPNGPAYVKNVFSGNDLEQNIVTEGIYGVPRRTIRLITNYDNPAKSDTTYIDANGLEARRNPGILARFLGNVHSDEFMNNIDSILNGMEPRQLSEKEVKRTKKNKEGGILFAQNGSSLSRAKTYYARYSDRNTIVKIQQFLDGKGYDVGPIDGIVGPKTFAAIQAYQRDHNLTADGMWGENTNSIHRVLNAVNSPYRKDASGPSGAHNKKEQGSNVTYRTVGKPMTDQELYRSINQLKEKFYSDPEAFWNNTTDMSQWREFLYKTPQGRAVMEEFYSATPDDVKNRIDPRKLPSYIQQSRFNKNITDGTNAAASTIATKVVPAAVTIMNPVTAAVAAGGAYLGSKTGRTINQGLHAGDQANEIVTDELGNQAVVVHAPENYYGDRGAFVGGIVGGTLGGAVAEMGLNGGLKYGTEHYYQTKTRPTRAGDLADVNGNFRTPDGRYTQAPENTGWFAGGNIFAFKRGGKL